MQDSACACVVGRRVAAVFEVSRRVSVGLSFCRSVGASTARPLVVRLVTMPRGSWQDFVVEEASARAWTCPGAHIELVWLRAICGGTKLSVITLMEPTTSPQRRPPPSWLETA